MNFTVFALVFSRRFRLSRWRRFLAASSALMLLSASEVSAGLPSYEVTVYSSLTAAGRKQDAPTSAAPLPCLLVNGGYREIGDRRAGEHSPDPRWIATLVHDGLELHHYRCVGSNEAAPRVVIVYRWGCAIPETRPVALHMLPKSDLEILDLVGGGALRRADLASERNAIFSAATDERYFVSIAAYAYSTTAAQNIGDLLWRTQLSVPCGDLTQAGAVRLLTAAGASLLGTETPLPRRITVNLTRDLPGAVADRR